MRIALGFIVLLLASWFLSARSSERRRSRLRLRLRRSGSAPPSARSATSRSTTSGRALPTPTHGTTRTSARSPMTSPTRTASTATRRAPCSRPGSASECCPAPQDAPRGSTASPATCSPTAAWRPPSPTRARLASRRRDANFQRVSLCAGCHDQHKTVQQWKATPHAEHREGCMECHMPYRDGTPEGGRVHVMPGGHYIDMVRSAVELNGVRTRTGSPE